MALNTYKYLTFSREPISSGLKDKNGKQISLGDLIRFSVASPSRAVNVEMTGTVCLCNDPTKSNGIPLALFTFSHDPDNLSVWAQCKDGTIWPLSLSDSTLEVLEKDNG